jgi:carboxyl-terminal processing protease
MPPAREPTAAGRRADALHLAAFVESDYATARAGGVADARTDWAEAQRYWTVRAESAADEGEFVRALEGLLDELYDPQCGLDARTPTSWRPVPYDVWPARTRQGVVVEAVRRGTSAHRVGLTPGARILAIDDEPIETRVAARLPAHARLDAEADAWALLSAVTGRDTHARRFRVQDTGGTRDLTVGGEIDDEPAVTWRRVRDVYASIRVAALSDPAAVTAFDEALAALQDTEGLLVDLRANADGDAAVMEKMMGRLVADRRRHASRARREGAGLGRPWGQYVQPRGPWTYEAPVVVLVDRFTAGAAEALAVGISGMGRGTVVGTRMAGLSAGVGRIRLPNSRLTARISTEPAYHLDGTPVCSWRPDVEVTATAGAEGDAAERRALEILRRDIRRAG